MLMFNKKIKIFLFNMVQNKENIKMDENEEITIKIINNDIENLGEVNSNMEFNIVVMGDEGKYIKIINKNIY